MIIAFSPANYLHVPVLYWPWVFVQLWQLYAWTQHHDREVLYEVLSDGRVAVWFVSDDKADLRAWLMRRTRASCPHLDYCDNAAGDLDINYFVLAIARAIERTGYRVRWVWVRIVLRLCPPIRDSS